MNRAKIKKVIKEIGRFIKKELNAKEVILFGSFASGKFRSDSDLDILVIMDTKLKPYKQSALIPMQLERELGINFPIDIIVRTPEQIKERMDLGDFFIKKILTEGTYL